MLLAPPTPNQTHEEKISRPSPALDTRGRHFYGVGRLPNITRPLSPSYSPPSPTSIIRRRTSSPTHHPLLMNDVLPFPSPSISQRSSSQTSLVPPIISTTGLVPSTTQSLALSVSSSSASYGSTVAPSSTSSVAAGSATSNQTSNVHHPLLGFVPHGNKILSRNFNGTLSVTSQPSNESELQLYRVLQRANLLNYYDTFISQGRVKGGDDVQQLCEAGEEEFLEIMALVGMASKPLHVRRLQKALQEWVSNPSLFQIQLLPNLPPSIVAGFSSLASSNFPTGGAATPALSTLRSSPPTSNHVNTSPGKESIITSSINSSQINGNGLIGCRPLSREGLLGSMSGAITPRAPSPGSLAHLPPLNNSHSALSTEKNQDLFLQIIKNAGCESPNLGYSNSGSPPRGLSPSNMNYMQNMMPILHESQIARLAQAASELVANMPPIDTRKDTFNKRKMSKELEMIMNMSHQDSRRMDEIRKYAAIYGRFDCKRKPEKPLTLHEVSVNEAAAQICKYMPTLLTRRDELFPLARQVVRDSGYQYSKGHSRSQTIIGRGDEDNNSRPAKRPRFDTGTDLMDFKQDSQWKKRYERLETISDELRAMSEKAEDVRLSLTSGSGNLTDLTQQMDVIQTRHAQLTLEQNELLKAQQNRLQLTAACNDSTKVSLISRSKIEATDEMREETSRDSNYTSYNNESGSPSQVISSSQGNIIAVTNPALSLSSALPVQHNSNHDRDHDDKNNINYYNYNVSKNCAIKQEPSSPATIPKSE